MREAKRSACCSVSGGLTKNLLGVWKPGSGACTERKMCLHAGTPPYHFHADTFVQLREPVLRLACCVFAVSGSTTGAKEGRACRANMKDFVMKSKASREMRDRLRRMDDEHRGGRSLMDLPFVVVLVSVAFGDGVEFVKAIRRATGMTVTLMAEEYRCSRTHLSLMLNGKRPLSRGLSIFCSDFLRPREGERGRSSGCPCEA